MVEIPAWLAAAAGGIIGILVATIGYLIQVLVSTTQQKLSAQDEKVGAVYGKLDEIRSDLRNFDRRFVEIELMATKQFVDKETYTRDWIVMTGKIDAVHKRMDHAERDEDD